MPMRFATLQDKTGIEDLLAYCFADMRADLVRRRAEEAAGTRPSETPEQRKAREENLQWVLLQEEENGKISQHVMIVPHTIHFDGNLHKMGGIGGVASLPEFRYGGSIQQLLRWSLQLMRERGQIFSELAPFSFAFYRKCGWEWGFRWQELTIPMKDLECFKGDVGVFAPLESKDRAEAIRVRNAHGKRYNGAEWQDPDREDDEFPKKNRTTYGVRNEQGALEGYATFHLEDGQLRCRDFFYLNHAAKRKLMHFFYRHNSQVSAVRITVPEGDTLPMLLGDAYVPVRATAGMMVRVVDVPAAFDAMRLETEPSGSLVMQVLDDMAPWNQGNWLVTAAGGRLRATRVENREPDCILTIQRLSQLVYGFLSGTDAVLSDLAEWRNDAARELFCAIFRKRPTAQFIPF